MKLFSYRGDLVLDPFNGAGTTTHVARALGRHFIGIDISQEYCETAVARTYGVDQPLIHQNPTDSPDHLFPVARVPSIWPYAAGSSS